MQQTLNHYHDNTAEVTAVRQVALNAPVKWLKAGFKDYMRTPMYSTFYGLIIVALGYLVTALSWQNPVLVMTFVTGFFLMGPFLVLGLYDLSRQQETGKPVRFANSLLAFKESKKDMGILAVFHGLMMIAWIRLATIISALYVGHNGINMTLSIDGIWQNTDMLQLFVTLLVFGAVMAAIVFVTSAVSWPMMLDRKTDVITAVATSYKAVMSNKAAMLIWAAIIGVLFVIGLATLYVALIYIIPILGHATWHAYKELVK